MKFAEHKMKKQDGISRIEPRNESLEREALVSDERRSDLSLSRSQSPIIDRANEGPRKQAEYPKGVDRLDTSVDRMPPCSQNFDMRKIFGEVHIGKQVRNGNGNLDYKSNNSEEYEFDSNSTAHPKRRQATNGLKHTRLQGENEKENLRAPVNFS